MKDCIGKAKSTYSGVYYVTPKLGKIEEVKVNIDQTPDIKDYQIILGKGSHIDEILDGSGKRAAIIFYTGETYSPFYRNSIDSIKYQMR